MSNNDETKSLSIDNETWLSLGKLVLFVIFILFIIFFLVIVVPELAISLGFDVKPYVEIIQKHFVATVGLPAAATAAFIVVGALRITDGPIRIKIAGVEFEGASGPVILWIAVFMSIAIAIDMLWPHIS